MAAPASAPAPFRNRSSDTLKFKIQTALLVMLISLASSAASWVISVQSRSAVSESVGQATAQTTGENAKAIAGFPAQYVSRDEFHELLREMRANHAESQQELLEIRNELTALKNRGR